LQDEGANLSGDTPMRPGPGGSREAWVRWARALAWATVGYNVFEGLVSMGFGAADASFALFGFGADSFIEVGSALLVLWRFNGEVERETPGRRRREPAAVAGIGVLFLLLGVGVAVGAVWQLATRRHPGSTVPGLAISLVSLASMLVLWREKRRAASALDSRAAAADASCSFACAKLSLVLLAGSVLFLLTPALWWADSAAAIGLAGMIGREGWEMLEARRTCEAR
jgi:divalent metal cation (Fe/Co/Zn/Cd) transporter